MNIIYKQPDGEQNNSLSKFDVQNCYFKKLSLVYDRKNITKKVHHHTGFEIHFITNGYQEYEIEGIKYKVESGNFLVIYPNVLHMITDSAPDTQKYSISFNKQIDTGAKCFFGILNKRMSDNITFISQEGLLKKEISSILVENSILEMLVLIFRMLGIKESSAVFSQNENAIISLAKQYINDNIELALSVSDVSEYCHISTKQLTRIFTQFEDSTPGNYIIKKRIDRIEKLMAEHSLSLSQISEKMHFSNEYYFNAFFKKHYGMPPGTYRKMLGI